MTPLQRFRRMAKLGLLVASALVMLLAGGIAQAAPTEPGTPVDATELSAEMTEAAIADLATLNSAEPVNRIRFEFRKNRQAPTKSRLILYRVTLQKDGPVRTLKLGSWRAGSGLGDTDVAGRDACASKKGWLPNGSYDAYPHETAFRTSFDGGLIFGVVWRLEDKKCKRGDTVRDSLFIHSEMTPSRTQACAPGNYREDQCWDDPSDYLSEGCIKLKPADIKQAARLARASGGPQPGQIGYPRLLVVTG